MTAFPPALFVLIARRPIARSHPARDQALPPGTLQERTITDPTPLPAPAAETAFPPALFVPDSVPADGARSPALRSPSR